MSQWDFWPFLLFKRCHAGGVQVCLVQRECQPLRNMNTCSTAQTLLTLWTGNPDQHTCCKQSWPKSSCCHTGSHRGGTEEEERAQHKSELRWGQTSAHRNAARCCLSDFSQLKGLSPVSLCSPPPLPVCTCPDTKASKRFLAP